MGRKSKEDKSAVAVKGKVKEATKMTDLGAVVNALNKELNASVVSIGKDILADVKGFVDTGSSLLNLAICGKIDGGYPLGRVIEMYGEPSSGKSTLSLHAMVACQKQGGIVIYIDSESSFDSKRAQVFGLDLNRMIYISPGTLEECYSVLFSMLARLTDMRGDGVEDTPVLVVVDTLAAMPDANESKDNKFAGGISHKARLNHEAFRKLSKTLVTSNTCLLLINQTIDSMQQYGAKDTTPGGRAPKFHASVRVKVHKIEEIKLNAGNKEKEESVGIITSATIVKNKVWKPMSVVNLPIYYFTGLNEEDAIKEFLIKKGVIVNAGGFIRWQFEGEDIKCRSKQFSDMMKENHKNYQYFLKETERLFLGSLANVEPDKDDDDDDDDDDEDVL